MTGKRRKTTPQPSKRVARIVKQRSRALETGVEAKGKEPSSKRPLIVLDRRPESPKQFRESFERLLKDPRMAGGPYGRYGEDNNRALLMSDDHTRPVNGVPLARIIGTVRGVRYDKDAKEPQAITLAGVCVLNAETGRYDPCCDHVQLPFHELERLRPGKGRDVEVRLGQTMVVDALCSSYGRPGERKYGPVLWEPVSCHYYCREAGTGKANPVENEAIGDPVAPIVRISGGAVLDAATPLGQLAALRSLTKSTEWRDYRSYAPPRLQKAFSDRLDAPDLHFDFDPAPLTDAAAVARQQGTSPDAEVMESLAERYEKEARTSHRHSLWDLHAPKNNPANRPDIAVLDAYRWKKRRDAIDDKLDRPLDEEYE